MKKIELFIEDYLVDIDEDVNISLIRQINDILDPSKIKNDFSRTISLPSTTNNNLIFGNIFSVNKNITPSPINNIGKDFNPSKKANFKLFINDQLNTSGYIKLSNIDFDDHLKLRYEINLFGELGLFFSLFDNDTLKDFLDETTPYGINKIKLNAQSIYNLWVAELTGSTIRNDFNIDELYSINNLTTTLLSKNNDSGITNLYLDIIEAENGFYDDGDKVQFYYGYNDDDETHISELGAKYTESRMCLKNSIKQRFGFYNDIMIKTIINKLGYELEDTDFINKSNPYWFNTLITTPILEKSSLNNIVLEAGYNSFTETIQSVTSYINYFNTITPNILTTNDFLTIDTYSSALPFTFLFHPLKLYSIDIPGFSIKVNTDCPYSTATKELLLNLDRDFITLTDNLGNDLFSGPSQPFYPQGTLQYISIEIFDEDDKLYKTISLSNNDSGEVGNIINYKFRYNNVGLEVDPNNDSYWIPFSDILTNINLTKRVFTNDIEDRKLFYVIKYQKLHTTDKLVNSVLPDYEMNNIKLKHKTPNHQLFLELDNKINSHHILKYNDLLPNCKVKEYFLSFVKLFGLYPIIDNRLKKVKLLTRTEFYENNKIIEWDDIFCNNLEHSINPLNFNTKYIDLKYKDSNDFLNKQYREKYLRSYGDQRLNTGYDFNIDTYNLFKDIIFEPTIIFPVFRDIFGNNADPNLIPHYYQDELSKSKIYNPISLVFNNGYKTITSKIEKIRGGYYFLFTDNTRESLLDDKNRYNFYQYNGIELLFGNFRLNSLAYGIDLPIGNHIDNNVKYRQSTTYYPSPNDIQFSLDIGRPFEVNFNTEYNSGTTIYDRYFKYYLEDRYSINTKIFTGYFKLNDTQFNMFKFSDFIFFKNKYWVVNKMELNNILKDQPIKVELVSINNLTNYTDGILNGYDIFRNECGDFICEEVEIT